MIENEREDDARVLASIPELPGVMAYGATGEVRHSSNSRGHHRMRRGSFGAAEGIVRRLRHWKEVKAKRVYAALLRIGWNLSKQVVPTGG